MVVRTAHWQTLFVDEATGIFLGSIKHQGFCKKGEYEKIRFIVDKWKALGIKNRAFNKYYFKYWIKYNTLLTFNLSRLIYKVTHPFK